MKLPLKKIRAEANIKRIKKDLEKLEVTQAQSQLQPMERVDDTLLVATSEDKKGRLLKELAKYEQILKEEG